MESDKSNVFNLPTHQSCEVRTEFQRDSQRDFQDDFVSIAAHEIRTPITALKAQAQIAERFRKLGTLDESLIEKTLQTFIYESDRLARVCNDLLDVAKIDTNALEIDSSVCLLEPIVKEVINTFDSKTTNHRLSLQVGSELRVFADPRRVKQVLGALLLNAIRYSPDGGAVIVRIESQGDFIVFSIEDEGLGIPVEKLPRIFERYYRAHEQGLKGPSGLGIGLYLAAEIVKRMSGTIWALSAGSNRGTKVCFSLPRREVT